MKEGNEEIASILLGGRGKDSQGVVNLTFVRLKCLAVDTFFSRENKSGDVSLREDRPLIVVSGKGG